MKVIKIAKSELDSGLEKLEKSFRLIGPVKEKEFHLFKPLDPGQKPDLEYSNTRLSARSVIYPQSEVMFEYSLDKNDDQYAILKEPGKDYQERAIIGIRPCDADAYEIVRRNFDTPEYKDPYWLKSFESKTLVGLACKNPCPTCFCKSAGSGPYSDKNLDIMLIDNGDHFLARVMTEKGEKLAQSAGWETAADNAAETIDKLKNESESKLKSSVSTDNLADQPLNALYEAEAAIWEAEAFSCINCGTCTHACPTCWCFDVQDETYGKSGVRMRNWDSCMYPLFSVHASGHNPRGAKIARVRQRFMHKLKYYVDKYEAGIQCTGCGRCVRLCPVNIDIRRICNKMNSYNPESCSCAVTS
jgi:sulfhydrogenase subunit beta (sulfur reductase)